VTNVPVAAGAARTVYAGSARERVLDLAGAEQDLVAANHRDTQLGFALSLKIQLARPLKEASTARVGLRDCLERRTLRADQPRLIGDDDQLRAVARTQLPHRVADVGAGGRRAEEQLGADLVVAQALSHQG